MRLIHWLGVPYFQLRWCHRFGDRPLVPVRKAKRLYKADRWRRKRAGQLTLFN